MALPPISKPQGQERQARAEVQSFATSTSVQILVMTIDSLRGDKNMARTAIFYSFIFIIII